ncbi:MAG: hypothetical protein ACK5KP_09350 [Paludibacteraceae bacterium]
MKHSNFYQIQEAISGMTKDEKLFYLMNCLREWEINRRTSNINFGFESVYDRTIRLIKNEIFIVQNNVELPIYPTLITDLSKSCLIEIYNNITGDSRFSYLNGTIENWLSLFGYGNEQHINLSWDEDKYQALYNIMAVICQKNQRGYRGIFEKVFRIPENNRKPNIKEFETQTLGMLIFGIIEEYQNK